MECIEGEVRLIDTVEGTSSQVLICEDGMFHSHCTDLWDNNAAAVVCRQLGLVPEGMKFKQIL